jgi:iron complex outermembrane receptor protein
LGSEVESNFAYILSQRAPNPSELFSDGLHHSIAAIEYGNLSLRSETSHKVLLRVSKNSEVFSWNLEPYISKIFDYIFIAPTGLEQTLRGAFPVWSYRSTNVFLTGVDFNSKIAIHRNINIDLAASYTYAQDQVSQNPLILIPPFNTLQRLKYRPQKGNWFFEVTHQVYAKQNRFPNSNFQFNLIEKGVIVSKIVDISESPEGFQKWDAVFSLELKGSNRVKKQLRLIVQNLTNADYRNYLNRMRFYASEVGRNFQIQFTLNY